MSLVRDVPFPLIAGHIQRDQKMNRHHALFGLSGSGKSHAARYGILPAAGPYAPQVVIDVKAGGDPVWAGWGNDVASVADIPCPIGPGPNGWPRWRLVRPGGLERADVEPALDRFTLEAALFLVMDDASSISETQGGRDGMGLGGKVDRMLREGRSNGLAVILGLNSTRGAGAGAKHLCATIWIGHTPNTEMRKEFAAVAGLPSDVQPALGELHARGRWLYSTSDVAEGVPVIALTTTPAAARGRA